MTTARYLAWLRSLGVGYVVLTDAAADYSARGEVALLRSGRSELRPAFRSRGLEILRVPQPRSIVTGPVGAQIRALKDDRITLHLRQPGQYRIAVRSSPYWTSSTGCVSRAPDGMLGLVARRAGMVRLRFSPTPARLFDVATGGELSRCAPRS